MASTPGGNHAGKHRRGGGTRRLWASGLAAAALTAGLVAPSLNLAEASARPDTDLVKSSRAATAPAKATKATKTSSATTTAAPTATTTPAPTATTTGATTQADGTTSGPDLADSSSATPAAQAPLVGAGPDGSTGSPLAGDVFYGPNTGAAEAAARPGTSPEDAALLRDMAQVPTATWLGQWSGDVTSTVRQVVSAARTAGAVPVFVAYNIPGRDCGGHSAGGVDSPTGYAEWVQAIATGIGSAEAVVIVEPDALAQMCGDPEARIGMLRSAVDTLEQNPGTYTYLDAGHSTWVDAATMAGRLRAAGAAGADGFALNVSNFGTTASNVAYGQELSGLLEGARFVVDTSRNGNGPGDDWCNPAGRAVGQRPTGETGHERADAFLWVKTPGESDGTCNGGPSAGTFWPAYAVALMRGV